MRVMVVTGMSREARALGHGARAWRRDAPGAALGAAAPGGCVLIAGVCGGLDPSLAPGALVLARGVVADDAPELVPDRRLFDAARRTLRASRASFVSSKLLTVPRLLDGTGARTDAWNTHGAAGVDMETYDIARECEARSLNWIVLRAVLDPAGMRLPRAASSWREDADERAIARAALLSPRDWPAYARLALQLRASLRALRVAVPSVAAALECVEPRSDAIPLVETASATG